MPTKDMGQKTKGVKDAQQQIMDLHTTLVSKSLPQTAPTYKSPPCHTHRSGDLSLSQWNVCWKQQTQEQLAFIMTTLFYFMQADMRIVILILINQILTISCEQCTTYTRQYGQSLCVFFGCLKNCIWCTPEVFCQYGSFPVRSNFLDELQYSCTDCTSEAFPQCVRYNVKSKIISTTGWITALCALVLLLPCVGEKVGF